MLVIGAKGMAKEILGVLMEQNTMPDTNLSFFDNINLNEPNKLYNRFEILKSFEEVIELFKKNKEFTLGVGSPTIRSELFEKFISLGGEFVSVISSKSIIGNFGTIIGNGSIIMPGVVITNDVIINKGVLVNINSTISHDSEIGSFSEIACGVVIPGRCKIGERVFIGSNATLNPDIEIGAGAVIGAGTVVIKNVPENAVVVGNPAKIIKYIDNAYR